MEGIERLQNEVLEMNNYNVAVIFDYLKGRTDLAEYFNNEEKSIKQMFDYICNKAMKQQQGNVAMIQDNVVYMWAVTYFTKSNEELGIKEQRVMPPSTSEVIEKIKKKNDENEKNPEEKKDDNGQISMFQEVQK